MADILTFQSKGSAQRGDGFLKDSGETLHFRQTSDGKITLDNSTMVSQSKDTEQLCHDWSNQELANLFRVKGLLDSTGIVSEIDRGLSDEGDPWFVFCRADDDVFIHFCRIGELYILDCPNLDTALRGYDFNDLILDFTGKVLPNGKSNHTASEEHRVVRLERGGKVCLHPSTLLAALVWTLFLASEELIIVKQGDDGDDRDAPPSPEDTLISFEGTDDTAWSENTTTISWIQPDEVLRGAPADVEYQASVNGHVQGQKDVHAHQGLVIAPNSYALGLSSIAIALGLLSERSVKDTYDDIMTGIDSTVMLLDGISQQDASTFQLDDAQVKTVAFLERIDIFLDSILAVNLREMITAKEGNSYEFDGANLAIEDTNAAKISSEILISGTEIEDLLMSVSHNISDSSGDISSTSDVLYKSVDNTVSALPEDTAATNFTYMGEVFTSLTNSLESYVIDSMQVYATFNPQNENIPEYELKVIDTLPGTDDLTLDTFSPNVAKLLPTPENKSVAALIDTALVFANAAEDAPDFDRGAADFVQSVLNNVDSVELLLVGENYIFLDLNSFRSDQASELHIVSWTTTNGGTVATIGLKSDLESLDPIA